MLFISHFAKRENHLLFVCKLDFEQHYDLVQCITYPLLILSGKGGCDILLCLLRRRCIDTWNIKIANFLLIDVAPLDGGEKLRLKTLIKYWIEQATAQVLSVNVRSDSRHLSPPWRGWGWAKRHSAGEKYFRISPISITEKTATIPLPVSIGRGSLHSREQSCAQRRVIVLCGKAWTGQKVWCNIVVRSASRVEGRGR
jgi:hypothetical protein